MQLRQNVTPNWMPTLVTDGNDVDDDDDDDDGDENDSKANMKPTGNSTCITKLKQAEVTETKTIKSTAESKADKKSKEKSQSLVLHAYQTDFNEARCKMD